MVVPAIDPGVEHVDAYIPKSSNFYCFFQGTNYLGGETYNISAPLGGNAPILLREGTIVFVNNVDNVMRTSDLTNSFVLKIVLKTNTGGTQYAEGFILGTQNYDEESIIKNCIDLNCVNKIRIEVSRTSQVEIAFLKLDVDLTQNDNQTVMDEVFFEELHIYGLESEYANSIFKYRPHQPISFSTSTSESLFVPFNN